MNRFPLRFDSVGGRDVLNASANADENCLLTTRGIEGMRGFGEKC
jgi:hypothetical protein